MKRSAFYGTERKGTEIKGTHIMNKQIPKN